MRGDRRFGIEIRLSVYREGSNVGERRVFDHVAPAIPTRTDLEITLKSILKIASLIDDEERGANGGT